ncbi:MAG: hypothetical protein LBK41_03390 [Clostridiales bacterium]|nr:hypothetical protein [Clostridiales bacterium]
MKLKSVLCIVMVFVLAFMSCVTVFADTSPATRDDFYEWVEANGYQVTPVGEEGLPDQLADLTALSFDSCEDAALFLVDFAAAVSSDEPAEVEIPLVNPLLRATNGDVLIDSAWLPPPALAEVELRAFYTTSGKRKPL